MSTEKVLHGVPKAFYAAYGGITPFPICLKSVSDYLGDEVDYTYAIVACGGAFRLAWNVNGWDGGNVDIMHAYADSELPFRYGINALGREFDMLWREGKGGGWHQGSGSKEDFKAFITAQIDLGRPVISLGPVGPAEAGIITGYRDGGDTLLGWSVFQDWACSKFDDEGYYITDKWWEEGDFHGVMSLGVVTAPRFTAAQIVKNAIPALEGRVEGSHAKGVAAYDPWKKALLGVTMDDFTVTGQGLADDKGVMMCEGDATDCLVDGRGRAKQYFERLAAENPAQPLYGEIAAQFGLVEGTIYNKIYRDLFGFERGPIQVKALAQPETRRQIAGYIDEMKAADERALELLKKLAETL